MDQFPADPSGQPERRMARWNKKEEIQLTNTVSQKCINFVLNIFGLVYIWIEQYKQYPDDDNVLGVNVDDDLHKMSRQQLCRYMDAVLPQSGFFELQSTTKIRLGCQLLRNFHLLKKELKRQE
tara:strand:+ start:2965 stop:3333 length:369 start_codon:yes stop_codon:yes gene_type:complete